MLNLRRPKAALLAALPLFAPACISPGGAPTIRYYSPAQALQEARTNVTKARPLWLRQVDSAGHLGQRFTWQKSDVEYGFRELVRWTEEPATFVRQALEGELYSHHFQRNESRAAYQLEIEVRAFEEQLAPDRKAHVAFIVRLADGDGNSLLERAFEHGTPIEGSDPTATARAMSLSLSVATREATQAIDRAAR